MFKNKKSRRLDCEYSRVIASWVNAGGNVNSFHFYEWMILSLRLDSEDAAEIYYLARTGKFELEQDARRFIERMSWEES